MITWAKKVSVSSGVVFIDDDEVIFGRFELPERDIDSDTSFSHLEE